MKSEMKSFSLYSFIHTGAIIYMFSLFDWWHNLNCSFDSKMIFLPTFYKMSFPREIHAFYEKMSFSFFPLSFWSVSEKIYSCHFVNTFCTYRLYLVNIFKRCLFVCFFFLLFFDKITQTGVDFRWFVVLNMVGGWCMDVHSVNSQPLCHISR